jgi:D-galactarolactone isomerase
MIEPLWPLPPNACDCHIHIYDLDAFPLQQSSPVSPPRASWGDYIELRTRLNISNCVIVQPMGYGFDNRCTLAALKMSEGSARAVISMPQQASDGQLAELSAAGVVGVRFQMVPNSGNIMTWDDLEPVAARIAPLGWNINLQLDGRTLPQFEERLKALPCNLVIDHVGKFLEPVELTHEAFGSLQRLLDTGRVWVKLSAMYETSRCAPPDYADVGMLAKALAHRYPQRCLWASNWPHPGQTNRPNDQQLLALLDQWCPSKTVRDQILADNPGSLYGFKVSA